MGDYTKVLIVLKDASNHVEYNRRILDYLNDRHTAINDNKYTLAIEVADDQSINHYVLQGMQSVPAMKAHIDEPFVYGVNSIIAALAKMKVDPKPHPVPVLPQPKPSPKDNFYSQMIIEEMASKEQEDPDEPSTVKAYRQDLPEAPLTDKFIEEKNEGVLQGVQRTSQAPESEASADREHVR